MALPAQGRNPAPMADLTREPTAARIEAWSLRFAAELYAEDVLTIEEFEDTVAWVLSGGDLALVLYRPPWPWPPAHG